MTTSPPRFQTFDDPSHAKGSERIEALRAALREIRADGFVVPRADEHQSEYVPAQAERLAWLTGFTGSAGLAVVLTEEAALFVDGRYTLQAPEQVDTGTITVVPLTEATPEAWLGTHLKPGQVLAYDPWLHTPDGVARLERSASKAGATLRTVPDNLVDAVWAGRPRPPAGRVAAHPDALAGETRGEKLDRIRAALAEGGLDALVISDPHNLAWTFNLPIGGRSLLEASIEARIKVTDTIGIVPFFDAGTAFASTLPDFDERIRKAAGIGLRYYTGIGPIRADLAFPLDRIKGNRELPVALYISLGQAF